MNGRSRLDRYQNLRSGMSGDNGRTENKRDGNYQINNESYSNFNSGYSDNSSKSYPNSDYDQLLREHEDFLSSLDKQFGQTNVSYNSNNFNQPSDNNRYYNSNYRQPDYSINYYPNNNQYDYSNDYHQYNNMQQPNMYTNYNQVQANIPNTLNQQEKYFYHNNEIINEQVIQPEQNKSSITVTKINGPVGKNQIEKKEIKQVNPVKTSIQSKSSFSSAEKLNKIDKVEVKTLNEEKVKPVAAKEIKTVKSVNVSTIAVSPLSTGVKVEKVTVKPLIKEEKPTQKVEIKEIKSLRPTNNIFNGVVKVNKVQKVDVKPLIEKKTVEIPVKEIKPVVLKNEKVPEIKLPKIEKVDIKPLQTDKNELTEKNIAPIKPIEEKLSKIVTPVIPQINKVEKVSIEPAKESINEDDEHIYKTDSVSIEPVNVKIPTIFTVDKAEQEEEITPIEEKNSNIEEISIPEISVVYGPQNGESFNPYAVDKPEKPDVVENDLVDQIDDILPEIFSEPQLSDNNELPEETNEDIKDLEVFEDESSDKEDDSVPITEDDKIAEATSVTQEKVIFSLDDDSNSNVEDLETVDLDDLSLPEENTERLQESDSEKTVDVQEKLDESSNEDIDFELETVHDMQNTVDEPVLDLPSDDEKNEIEETSIEKIDTEECSDDTQNDQSESVAINEDETKPQIEEEDLIIEDEQPIDKNVSTQVENVEDTINRIIDRTDKTDEETIFAYINDTLNSVEDYRKNPNIEENTPNEPATEQQKLNAEEISDILNSWNFDNEDESDISKNQPSTETESKVEKVKTDYEPKNNIEAPVYHENPIDVDRLTEKLEKERVLRQQMLEQTKQINLQVKEYENELDSVNDSMSKTNKILNFVLTLLIMTLFVILFVIGFWFAQERGLL
ncbi:MAG: hypothetical protein Q4C64_00420 [Erysipelotrichia bacterium]|nr:hypothetical protein [Erysipelotrichia bacterium]